MKDKRRRLQLDIDEPTKRVLSRYAEAMDSSVPKVTAALLKNAAPEILKMAEALEDAKKGSGGNLSLITERIREIARERSQKTLGLD